MSFSLFKVTDFAPRSVSDSKRRLKQLYEKELVLINVNNPANMNYDIMICDGSFLISPKCLALQIKNLDKRLEKYWSEILCIHV